MRSEQIDLSEFVKVPYLHVLTYPRPNLAVARARMKQLSKLGVEKIAFSGTTKIGRLGLVGLGTVSVVVRATLIGNGEQQVALKIRRTDANRPSMFNEYELTQMANRVSVGAYAMSATKDLMVMQLVEGEDLDDYLRGFGGVGTRARLREVIHRLLNQCRKLDLIGLDHGQLSDLRKHVIMAGDVPYIIDFESSSMARRSKNVTTAAQNLIVGGRSSPLVRRLLGLKSQKGVLRTLKDYKRDMSDGNYVALVRELGITT